MSKLVLDQETYQIIGAAMTVYNTLGTGFLEAVYQEAMELELSSRQIVFESQKELLIIYKGQPLKKAYIADLVVYGRVIVELKAINQLTSREEAQLLNYLKATGCAVGLLLNFGADKKLEWKRMALTMK